MRFSFRWVALAMVMAAQLGFVAAAQVPDAPQKRPVADASVPVTETVHVAPRLTEDDVSAWLDGFMPFALDRGDVAGAVVTVVRDGSVLAQRGYGYADTGAGTPVDPETTLFRPGSVSKLITWTAVMQLVDEGRIDLDADVNTYLDFKVPARGQPITVRQLLTHTTGLAERVKGLMTVGPEPIALGDYLKAWVPEQIHEPGTTPAYSNYATALAGYLVERVSGLSFDDYLDRHIFGPLEMHHSTFRQPLPERLQPLMSKGYRLGSGEPLAFEVVPAAPAGSMSSSGVDMAKFMIAHLQGSTGEDSPILSARAAQEMHAAQTNFTPPLNTMALGFYEASVNGHRVIGHGGDTQWFHSYLYLFVDSGVGLYVSMNSAGIGGVTGPIRTDLLRQFADRYFPDERAPAGANGVDAETAQEHARMMASHSYWNSRRAAAGFVQLLELQQLSFSVNEDGTISTAGLRGTNGQPIRWREVAPLLWQDVDGRERLAAVVEDGRISHWTMESVAPIMQFQPVPGWRASSWLLPLFGLSLLAMVLAALWWPAAALVRRRYGARLERTGQALRVYRLSRVAIVGTVLVWLGWIVLFSRTMADFRRFSTDLDKWLVLLGIGGWVAGLGGIGLLVWNAWIRWTDGSGWWSRISSMLLVAAALILFYVALLYGLLSFATEY